ncbi:hypothetical protein T492DRAFT_1093027 [Pavlovales sp. CCMP2436]|nr:hypothetical protein T492DRAFT_1093027 [Pavlovales sp. CCMP2436]
MYASLFIIFYYIILYYSHDEAVGPEDVRFSYIFKSSLDVPCIVFIYLRVLLRMYAALLLMLFVLLCYVVLYYIIRYYNVLLVVIGVVVVLLLLALLWPLIAGGTCRHGGFTRESDVVMNRR